MENCDENVIEKCRICDISVIDGDFVALFITHSNHEIERTYSGELFDELIQLPSTEDTKFPYICNGCDLQMKLFKRLKDKAWKRLAVKAYTSELEIETCDSAKNSQNTADGEGFDNTILIVYDVKGQSVQSVNTDDLIEIENSNEDDNRIEDQEEETTQTTSEAEKETQSVQVHKNVYNSKETTENHLKSTETACKDCGLILSSMRALKNHRQEHHGRTHPCTICQKLFKTAENLEGHMRQHSGLPPYQCETCDKTFNQKVHYQYHMKRHKNERDFACNLCDKSFFNKSDLTMHIKRLHEGERNFVCSFPNCGKHFYFEQHLTYHSYVHSGKKNFQCDKCSQQFVAPNALALHKRTIHCRNMSFECAQCFKTFRRKHHLEAHYAIHEEKTEKSSSHDDFVLNRKGKVLKPIQEGKFRGITDIQRDGVDEIDESTLQTMQEQSDDNEFFMEVIESCSEADN